MQTNANGEVAIKYFMQVPQHVVVGAHEYMFMVRGRICLAWIKPEDTNIVLAKKKGCCGGVIRSNVFQYATEQEVERWINNG